LKSYEVTRTEETDCSLLTRREKKETLSW
jgi:hypothetical protein